MKLLALAAICGLLAYVAAEPCHGTNDCSHVSCDPGHDLTCHLRQCTCTDHGQTCSGSGGCTGHCSAGSGWHCVDNHCRCGWLPGGIGGIGGIGK